MEKMQKSNPAPKKTEAPAKKSPQPFGLVRGTRDILPIDQSYWRKLYEEAEGLCDAYGLERIETPVLEETGLFVRGVGKQTEIVEKEMYSFETAGGDNVTMRPEATASMCRAYIYHGMWNQPQPVKLWYWSPMFRHERPQSGRYREFWQFGAEILGEEDAVIDAQLALISWRFLKDLGIDASVRINSIGTPECRANYKNALVAYFRPKRSRLSEDDKKKLLKNPLRLLDPFLVRGLDYYTKTVFELYDNAEEDVNKNALGGGGRYDGLMEILGGRPTPAAGFGMGIDRIVSRLKSMNIAAPQRKIDVFVAQLGEGGRKKALAMFEELRLAGIKSGEAFAKGSIKTQMEFANRAGARWTIIIGQKEVLDGTAIVRDMDAGTQEIVDARKIVQVLQKKMAQVQPESTPTIPPSTPAV